MYCIYCGKNLKNEDKFCPSCGKPVVDNHDDSLQDNSSQECVTSSMDEEPENQHRHVAGDDVEVSKITTPDAFWGSPKTKKLFIACIVFLAFCMLVAYLNPSASTDDAKKYARVITNEWLDKQSIPSTSQITFHDQTILDRDAYNRYLVEVTIKESTPRGSSNLTLYVVFRITGHGTYEYNPYLAVGYLSEESTKSVNNWGIAPK